MQEQRSRSQLKYYPFTKQQVLRASVDEFVDRHEGYLRLRAFLHKNWEMAAGDADLTAAELMDLVQQGAAPTEIVAPLQEQFEFSSMEELQELLNVVMLFVNQTRQWILKGYSPEELFREEKKHLKELPQPRNNVSTEGTVYSFETRTKVGRNDPCTCGSAKKFKRCCGK